MSKKIDGAEKQIKNLIAEIFGNEIQREALEKLIHLVMYLMKKDYDEMEKEKMRRGD